MTSELEKRKKASEAKFAVGEKLLFQATVKRDRLVSEWIAQNFFAISDKESTEFVECAVKANLEKPGDDDIINFFEKIFVEKNVPFYQNEIIEKLATTYDTTLKQASQT